MVVNRLKVLRMVQWSDYCVCMYWLQSLS